jgi:CRP-like cAMP-binding protein
MNINSQSLGNYCYFSGLSDSALEELSKRIYSAEYPVGAEIIREGDVGDSFYFVNRGKVEVIKTTRFRGERSRRKASLSILGHGEIFGEMALVTNSPRSATVIAKTDVTLFELRKADFEQIVLMDSQFSDVLESQVENVAHFNTMKTLEPFVELQPEQMGILFNKFSERKFEYGQTIIKQGDEGNEYFIIKSGSVAVRKELPNGESTKLAILTARHGFGDEALLTGALRSATVQAMEKTTVWVISKQDFDDILKFSFLEEVAPADAAREAQNGKNNQCTFIDVRTNTEFEDEHIQGSVNIPLDALRGRYSFFDPKKKYFVYCLVGIRSPIAAFLLKMHGFHARSIRGGFQAWTGPLDYGTAGVHMPSKAT